MFKNVLFIEWYPCVYNNRLVWSRRSRKMRISSMNQTKQTLFLIHLNRVVEMTSVFCLILIVSLTYSISFIISFFFLFIRNIKEIFRHIFDYFPPHLSLISNLSFHNYSFVRKIEWRLFSLSLMSEMPQLQKYDKKFFQLFSHRGIFGELTLRK